MFQTESAILNQFSPNRANYVGNCRFFNNKSVETSSLCDLLTTPTRSLVAGKHVLSIQDTSSLNFIAHHGKLSIQDPDLGLVGNKKSAGFFLHPSLVVDATSEAILGLADIHIWNRGFCQPSKKARNYQKQPLEEKESYRWLSRSNCGKEVLRSASRVTVIADRESDIYEDLLYIPDHQTDIIFRAGQNRRLYESPHKLFGYLETLETQACFQLKVTSTKTRKARIAHMELKYGSVKIARPVYGSEDLPEYVSINVVLVQELPHTIPAGEEAICWRLLTTHPVNSVEDALQIIDWYKLRWLIEQLFRILKNKGLQIEDCQLETGFALKKLTIMALDTATKILQLVQEREGKNGTPAQNIFGDHEIEFLGELQPYLEGKTDKQKNPYSKKSLAWAAWCIARLGGWKGYASEAPPGPITMKRGLEKFQQQFIGWSMTQKKDL